MRLGEVLVEAAVLDREQLAEGLRAQVVWGARLGTNLVELGHLQIDDLSKALGKLHQMPAALGKHFERADPELQTKLPTQLAQKYSCVPLVMAKDHCVIALEHLLAPSELAQIAIALGVAAEKLVPAIAGELRMAFQLEKVYGIARDPRMVRSRGTRSEDSQIFRLQPSIDPLLELSLSAGNAEAVPLLEEQPSEAAPEPTGGRFQRPGSFGLQLPEEPSAVGPAPTPFDPLDDERRTYLKTLADILAEQPDSQQSVMVHLESLNQPVAKRAEPPTLTSATQWIFKGPDREQIAHRVIAAINKFVPAARAAVFLVVRGRNAVSWTSFCRDGTELPPIALPLDQPGLLPVVMRRGSSARASSGDLNSVDFLLLAALGARHGELLVAPISVAEQVISVVALATAHRAVLDGLDQITTATGAAFARLMRDAGARA
ncbi:hypothetical protein BH11MYX2_BH11MYX2_25850 [soil metagenome]